MWQVHPSLVVNLDQTGLHLVPAGARTYEVKGSKQVSIARIDDKRQITAVVESSLDGCLLPLQLIFQGKTDASLPPHTDESRNAKFHLTKSSNHWSSQETMQEWCKHIFVPWRDKMIEQHNLPNNAAAVLQLDVWAVHISKEFRAFINNHHPYIRLVYIPPSCTSKLQVADVVLNYPFKYGIKKRFNAWAARIIAEQVASGETVGIKPHLKMSQVKPKILQWALESWSSLREEKLLILKGWHKCVVSLYNVHDKDEQKKATQQAVEREIDASDAIPARAQNCDQEVAEEDQEQDGEEAEYCEEESEDEDKTEKEVMKERVYGERKSSRDRKQAQLFGYQLDSARLKFS